MYIKVRVKAGQKKEILEEKSENNFVLSIKEKAERNLANKRLLEVFENKFKTKNIRIISGHQHPIKMLSVEI
jgi:uncharacterized protein YggU (UPF0235/DUF167 family)